MMKNILLTVFKQLFEMWSTSAKILFRALMMWSYNLFLPLILILVGVPLLKDGADFFKFAFGVYYVWVIGFYKFQIVLFIFCCGISIKDEVFDTP